MIVIADRQSTLKLPISKLKALAARVMTGEKLGPGTLSLAFVDNPAIRTINRDFLNHDYATDVIAFLLDEEKFFGEVVISTQFAQAEAKKRNIPLVEEVARYVVHGTLHLAGYDDHSPAKKRVMWKRQENYLTGIVQRSDKRRGKKT